MHSAARQTLLFIGDSITHAHRRPEELHDCYQLGSGYVNSIAAELQAAEPSSGLQVINRGECGDTVAILLQRWEKDCLLNRPDFISILIGVNDAHHPGLVVENFADHYRQLLDFTRRRLPSAKLILLEPFGVQVPPHSSIETISTGQLARLAQLRPIVRELASAADALLVPLQHLFDGPPASTWTLDGIHPSAAGHWRIAREWVAVARKAGWFPTLDSKGVNA